MTLPPPSDHFKGKSVVEHLKEARTRGMMASSEIHGTEMSGQAAAFADSLRDSSVAFLLLWVVLGGLLTASSLFAFLIAFSFGWIIWKTARSALIGWARVERLHRLIEEERWEIEHHRHQERQELKELYQAKGFEGALLEQVVEVMMADDNRLLQIMLEEEMGLTLEAYEHPLKQAFGAAIGAFCAAAFCIFAYSIHPIFGLPIISGLFMLGGAVCTAKLERNNVLHAVVWNGAVLVLSSGAVYFIKQILLGAK